MWGVNSGSINILVVSSLAAYLQYLLKRDSHGTVEYCNIAILPQYSRDNTVLHGGVVLAATRTCQIFLVV